jgi:hypothetical protein
MQRQGSEKYNDGRPLRKLGSSVRLGYAPYAKQRIYPPDLISDLSVTCSLAQRRERRQRFMADG